MSDITELVNDDNIKADPVSKQIVLEMPDKEEELEGGGLITKEFFEFNLNNVYEYSRNILDTYKVKHIRFSNQEYIPLYGINFKVDQYLPAAQILNGSFEMNSYEELLSKKNGNLVWQQNKLYTEFIKKCLDKKLYNIILFINHKRDSACTSKDELKNNLKQRFTDYTSAPIDLTVMREGRNAARSYADIVANTKYYCGWARCRTKRKDPAAPVLNFLTNFYYMAKLSEQNGNYWIEPMFSVMVKKEYLSYVRACLLTNTPIPVEILELWIDEKLDNKDSDYKIRPTFVKSIRTPFKAAGMKVRVFEDLFSEMYTRLKLPKFKALPERMLWTKKLTEQLLNKEKVRLGIRVEETEPKPSLFTLSELVNQTVINKAEVSKKLEEFSELLTELT